MRLALCLVLLALCGALSVLDPGHFGFFLKSESTALTLWTSTLKCYMVPVFLVVMGMTRSRFITAVDFLLGVWVSLTTIAVVATAPELFSNTSRVLFLLVVMLLGFSIALFATLKMIPLPKLKKF
jgi:hypothetical protein